MGLADAVDLVALYQDLMRAVNIADKPQRAIDRGFYVPRSNSRIKDLAAQFTLEPQSTHLLIGGIGSGKTTELLHAQAMIERVWGTKVFYIDVAEKQRLSELKAGVLLSLVGLELAAFAKTLNAYPPPVAIDLVHSYANGYSDPYTIDDDEDPNWHHGIVTAPRSDNFAVRQLGDAVSDIRGSLPAIKSSIIFIFDSLDRVHDQQKLADVIKEDVVALKQAGIGVVLVGPLYALYWENQSLINYFDQYSILHDIDPDYDPNGRDFLFKVLRTRVPIERASDAVCLELVSMSGGILRDLLNLTKAAARRAFMEDAVQLDSSHVKAAAEIEGRKLLFGTTPQDLDKLRALVKEPRFTLATKEDLLLLEHRRIIQYESRGQPIYELHPTLRLLLYPNSERRMVFR